MSRTIEQRIPGVKIAVTYADDAQTTFERLAGVEQEVWDLEFDREHEYVSHLNGCHHEFMGKVALKAHNKDRITKGFRSLKLLWTEPALIKKTIKVDD